MRIVQVNTADRAGGAERIAHQLFDGYKKRGHESWLLVGYKRGNDPYVIPIQGHWSRFWSNISGRFSPPLNNLFKFTRLNTYLPNRVYTQLGWEERLSPDSWRLLEMTPQKPDILHFHNLHSAAFDLRALTYLSQQIPVVVTLHDAWLLSGHCAHSFDCERWKTGCGNCPDLTIYPAIKRDATAHNWQRKQTIYKNSQLYLATPARWLMNKVENSMLMAAIKERRVIPHGVELSIFHPGDKAQARAELGIPAETHVLLFTANAIRRNVFKDYQTLRNALSLIGEFDTPTILLALGDDAPSEQLGNAQIRFIPFQTHLETVATYYRAADIYLHSARADTFPNTVLEALACGVPVIGTAVGGIPEQVEDGKTGYLVPPSDASAIASRVQQLLNDDDLRREMGAAAALTARQKYDVDAHVDHYLTWYESILQREQDARPES